MRLTPRIGVRGRLYDADGRRIEKDVDGVVTRYVYDGDNIVLEYDGANALAARYTHGEAVDQPLSMERGGQSYFYLTDFLGSVRKLTNASGAVVNAYDYDAYGNFETRSEAVANPYTYTAREFDPESGLMFYRARYYDPVSGRFLSEDPIGLESGDVNPYRYVFNTPTMLVDPDGQSSLGQFALFAVGATLAILPVAAEVEIRAAERSNELPSLCRVGVFSGLTGLLSASLFAASTTIVSALRTGGVQGGLEDAAIAGPGVGLIAFKAVEGAIQVTTGICGPRDPL